MRKPAYNASEIARSIVVAVLKRSRIDLINCSDLPPLPDHNRLAVERRGHLRKVLLPGARASDKYHRYLEPLFRRKVPVNLGRSEYHTRKHALVAIAGGAPLRPAAVFFGLHKMPVAYGLMSSRYALVRQSVTLASADGNRPFE
jgi:hypothetical protein